MPSRNNLHPECSTSCEPMTSHRPTIQYELIPHAETCIQTMSTSCGQTLSPKSLWHSTTPTSWRPLSPTPSTSSGQMPFATWCWSTTAACTLTWTSSVGGAWTSCESTRWAARLGGSVRGLQVSGNPDGLSCQAVLPCSTLASDAVAPIEPHQRQSNLLRDSWVGSVCQAVC